MPRTLNHLVNAAACTRKAKARKNVVNNTQQPALDLVHGVDIGLDPPSDSEICSWDGDVNHNPSDVEEITYWNGDSEEEGFSDMEGVELLQSLQKAQQKELERLENVSKPTAFDKMS